MARVEWRGLESREQRMREVTKTTADDSFGGEWVMPSEKGRWPQEFSDVRRERWRAVPTRGAAASSESHVSVKAVRTAEDNESAGRSADHAGPGGSE